MGKSSKDKRDAYYRLAKEQGWRARSAFKLLQLDEEFNLFEGVSRVVDLCAAPGSWSQVLSRVLIKGEKFGRAAWTDKADAIRRIASGEKDTTVGPLPQSAPPASQTTQAAPRTDVRIVAVDLQPISPLAGITTLRADITHPRTIPQLLHALDPDLHPDPSAPDYSAAEPTTARPVDLILSDGAPDVTGLHDLDTYIQSQLIFAALNVALRVLKPGGKFVAKIFRAGDVDLLYAQLRVLFERVTVAKPRSSRASSVEAFVVCEGFSKPEGLVMGGLEETLRAGAKMEASTKVRKEVKRWVREDGITEVELGATLGEDEDDDGGDEDKIREERGQRWIAPFLACGDLDAFDSDATYHLPPDHVSLDPVQPPTAPPYKRALEIRRTQGGAYGKTKGGKAPQSAS